MFSTYLKITEKKFIHSTVLILNFIPVLKDISITSVFPVMGVSDMQSWPGS